MDNNDNLPSLVKSLNNEYQRLKEKNAYFRSKYQGNIKAINKLDDMNSLPFTTKQELVDLYPYSAFCEHLSNIVEIHASNGTKLKPTFVGYTKNDLELWKQVILKNIDYFELNENDIVQNSFGYGLFTGAFGWHYGLLEKGATILPISSGNTEKQVMLMQDMGTTVLFATPSYAGYLAAYIQKEKIDLKKFKLRKIIYGAEPASKSIISYIEGVLGVETYNTYGLSEIIGPGVACECSEHSGLHVMEENFYFEIIDKVTEKPLPEGEFGELVISTIGKECSPVIRYKTGDITCIIPGVCKCGSKRRRISNEITRKDDMIIIKGINIYPSQIEEVISAFDELSPVYEVKLNRDKNLKETISISIASTKKIDSNLINKFSQELGDKVGVSFEVIIVSLYELQHSGGKAKRFIDLRV